MARVKGGITRRVFNVVQQQVPDAEAVGMPDRLVAGKEASSTPALAGIRDPLANDADTLESAQLEPAERRFNLPPFHPKTKQLRAAIDGPYGHTTDPAVFESAVFIAGGSGITYVLPVLLDLLRRVDRGQVTLTKRVRVLWTMRSRG